MNIFLGIAVAVLVIYFEWDLVTTALTPLCDIVVAVFFIVMLLLVIVAELALVVVAPTALFFGYESRQWHVQTARKLMFAGGKKNEPGPK